MDVVDEALLAGLRRLVGSRSWQARSRVQVVAPPGSVGHEHARGHVVFLRALVVYELVRARSGLLSRRREC